MSSGNLGRLARKEALPLMAERIMDLEAELAAVRAQAAKAWELGFDAGVRAEMARERGNPFVLKVAK